MKKYILIATILISGCTRNHLLCEWSSPNNMTENELRFCESYTRGTK